MNTAVIGFGGAGCRVLNLLIAQGFPADFIAVDTNEQSLSACLAHEKFLIRRNDDITGVDLHDGARVHSALTRRSGASFITDGAPVLDALQDMDKTVWIAGLGGACGSGALPVALNQFVHSKKGRPDVTPVLSIPFSWEGETRMRTAFRALLSIAPNSRNKYLVVNCQNVFSEIDKETVVGKAFELIDEKMADLIRATPRHK
jgi:cell division GTPase FtsZ